KGQLVSLTSKSAVFNSSNYTARFQESVVADYGSYRVTGNAAILEVDQTDHNVDLVTVQGDVRLSDVQRWAVAEKIRIFPQQRKMVLSGRPRLIQNNNELSGEEITFYEEGQRIQIKKAK